MKLTVLALILLLACAIAGPPQKTTWSSPTLTCGGIVSHPCPRLTYARNFDVEFGPKFATVIWSEFRGGQDAAGNPVSEWLEETEQVEHDGLVLHLPGRGDDAGFRLPAEVDLTERSFEIHWDLFNVPGETTFVLEVSP